jgi:hypothetical protein
LRRSWNLSSQDLLTIANIRTALEAEIDRAGPADCEDFRKRAVCSITRDRLAQLTPFDIRVSFFVAVWLSLLERSGENPSNRAELIWSEVCVLQQADTICGSKSVWRVVPSS